MIHFDSGSAALSAGGESILEEFAVQDLRWGLTTKIVVIGYADTVGGHSANLALSRRRANTVAAYLSRRGIKPSRIELVALGERHLNEATPDETASASNRVVKIREDVPPKEMIRRRTAWSAFPNEC